MKGTQGRPAHHFPVTALTSARTVSDLPSATAPLFCPKCAEKVRIQYGGSMNAKNADELLAMPDVDGGLIGGAALKAQEK